MASYVLCNLEVLVTLRFKQQACHFTKPGDFKNISVSKILHFVQGAVLPKEWATELHKKVNHSQSVWVTRCPFLCCYSVLLHRNQSHDL